MMTTLRVALPWIECAHTARDVVTIAQLLQHTIAASIIKLRRIFPDVKYERGRE